MFNKIDSDVFALNLCDFYKTGHYKQFPACTEKVYSNFTCRSDKHFNGLNDFDHKTVFFGLQAALIKIHELFDETFFSKPLGYVVNRYKNTMDTALGEHAVTMDNIVDLHKLQYLPIKVKALPEGSRVNIRVPLWTITNTLPNFYWLTNYLETILSTESWLPITSATTAFEYRRLFERYAYLTGVDRNFCKIQGHDFSMRGMGGLDAALLSGAAHLTCFYGTDTIPAIDFVKYYYNAEGFVGGSVPASEHSVVCMGGEDDELETFRRLIEYVAPRGVISVVSDTWDYWKVITEYFPALKDIIMSRKPDANGLAKVVARPDSGDPVKIILGDKTTDKTYVVIKDGVRHTAFYPAYLGTVQVMYNNFPGLDTKKDFNQLDSHVGVIYGDSITLKIASEILAGLHKKSFASNVIVFGIGSFTYQYVTRDTFGCAIKATYGVVNSEPRNLCKKPKTDSGMKNSASGLLRVELEDGNYVLYENQTEEQENEGELTTVYYDGNFLNLCDFDQIRSRIDLEIAKVMHRDGFTDY